MAALTRSSIWLFTLLLGTAPFLAASARADDVEIRLDAGSGFSIREQSGFGELLRVDEATGNISRNGVLFVHTTGGGNNTFVGANAASVTNTGPNNSAFGQDALRYNTGGGANSAFGFQTLRANTTGYNNNAFGFKALYSNTGGSYNSAVGFRALASSTTGIRNVAFGSRTMEFNTTGTHNSAFGDFALRRTTTGSRNIGLGYYAGASQTTGSNNIYLANTGVDGESGQIKIGSSGTHTGTTIAGISGATSASGIPVLVNVFGKLGTATSSARFKQDVRDMGEASDVLMKLRPVTFRYREEAVGEEDAKTPQYGLIAEEVAEVAPELVAPDLDGKPYSVKYHELPALLLNEVQEQARNAAEQQRTIEAQARLLSEQREVIAALSTRLARLEKEQIPALP